MALLLSAADVVARRDQDALARLDERSGLREAFEAERDETRPDRRTLYFDAVTGWRFIDLCDLCGGDIGLLDDPQPLAALCDSCDELERVDGRVGHEQARRAG
ncbi:hypothetical protein [Jannaschia sp. R86511]|uniref:hypothetical protein n=1 Tax=Jannaschia sp. R86511 TaxID=3093853 RepID=UPI0036D2DC6E